MQYPQYLHNFQKTRRSNINRNILQDLQEREIRGGGLSDLELYGNGYRSLPNNMLWSINSFHDVHCGIFNKIGDMFFCASLGGRVSVFDHVERYLRLTRFVKCVGNCGGFISMLQSPDQQYLAIVSENFILYLIDLDSTTEVVTEVAMADAYLNPMYSFAFCGTSNTEIVYGTSMSRLAIFDVVAGVRKEAFATMMSFADVNAVAWLQDGDSTFLAGSDDTCIRKYDKRSLCVGPVAVYPGHLDGITSIDSKNDGRYFLSNSKDQTVRLWDVRLSAPINQEKRIRPVENWDYRIHQVPRAYLSPQSEEESKSLLTLRGHRVRYNQIRAKFSPLHSTGQQFAYSGCANGGWLIWDLSTSKKVASYRLSNALVREVSWHPWQPVAISCSVDGSLTYWNFESLDRLLPTKHAVTSTPVKHRLCLNRLVTPGYVYRASTCLSRELPLPMKVDSQTDEDSDEEGRIILNNHFSSLSATAQETESTSDEDS